MSYQRPMTDKERMAEALRALRLAVQQLESLEAEVAAARCNIGYAMGLLLP